MNQHPLTKSLLTMTALFIIRNTANKSSTAFNYVDFTFFLDLRTLPCILSLSRDLFLEGFFWIPFDSELTKLLLGTAKVWTKRPVIDCTGEKENRWLLTHFKGTGEIGNYYGKTKVFLTYSSLILVNLLVCKVWHLFERVDRDQHWTNIGLFNWLRV